jgi:hypothetical protein
MAGDFFAKYSKSQNDRDNHLLTMRGPMMAMMMMTMMRTMTLSHRKAGHCQ